MENTILNKAQTLCVAHKQEVPVRKVQKEDARAGGRQHGQKPPQEVTTCGPQSAVVNNYSDFLYYIVTIIVTFVLNSAISFINRRHVFVKSNTYRALHQASEWTKYRFCDSNHQFFHLLTQ